MSLRIEDAGYRFVAPEKQGIGSATEPRHGFEGIIGVGQVDITPPVGIRMRNWAAANYEVAEGIHMPLEAYCLTFQAKRGDVPMVLLALDLGGWRSPEHEMALRGPILRELGLPESHLMIHLTHTHAGPSTNLDEMDQPGGDLMFAYFGRLIRDLTELARMTWRLARWSLLEWTYGWCPLSQNRDVREGVGDRYLVGVNPAGDADQILTLGRITGFDQQVRGTILSYACHPTTLAWQNRLLSPDYPGTARQVVSEATGAPCVFLQGFSGDLGPIRGFTGNVAIAEQNGRALGHAALSAYQNFGTPGTDLRRQAIVESAAPIELRGEEPIGFSKTLGVDLLKIELELTDLPSEEELTDLLEISEALDPVTENAQVIIEQLRRKLQLRRSVGQGDSIELKVWAWRIGWSSWFGLPAEAYSQMTIDLRRFASHPLICMNVVNGWCGYLPTAGCHNLDIYSVNASPFQPDSLRRVTWKMEDILKTHV